MSAYDYIDTARAGLLSDLDNQIEGGWAAKPAAGIEFGYPVFGYVGDKVSAYTYFGNDVSKLVFDADFVASNSIVITVNTVSAGAVVYATSHDNTMDLVLAALNAMTGVEAVLDATDTDNRTFFILTKGVTCVVTEAVTGGASQPDGTITQESGQVYLGMAVMTQNSAGLYEQYDAVNVLVKGKVWAQCSTAAAANMLAYVGAAGKMANSGGATTAKFRSDLAAAGLVLVETNGQVVLGSAALFA